MKVEIDGEQKDIDDLRVVDLKALLSRFDLSRSGTKSVLAKRLLEYLKSTEKVEVIEEEVEEVPSPIVEEEEEGKKEGEIPVVEERGERSDEAESRREVIQLDDAIPDPKEYDLHDQGEVEKKDRKKESKNKTSWDKEERIGKAEIKASTEGGRREASPDKRGTSTSMIEVEREASLIKRNRDGDPQKETSFDEEKTKESPHNKEASPHKELKKEKSRQETSPDKEKGVDRREVSPDKDIRKVEARKEASPNKEIRKEDASKDTFLDKEKGEKEVVRDFSLVKEKRKRELDRDASPGKEEKRRREDKGSPKKSLEEKPLHIHKEDGNQENLKENTPSDVEDNGDSGLKMEIEDEDLVISKDNEEMEEKPIKVSKIPFRKLSKSVAKEERKNRGWGDISLEEKPVEAVSTESLKDIIPDLKPLLETNELVLQEEEEKMELEINAEVDEDEEECESREIGVPPQKSPEKKSEEEPSEEGEIPPTKRFRIGPSTEKIKRDENESEVLLIRNLVRPFTLTQLKELLKRTGTIEDFWINKIKSHCFVRFANADQASETRHALDGVKWPNSNPKTLSVTFSTRKSMEETAAEQSAFETVDQPLKPKPVESTNEGKKSKTHKDSEKPQEKSQLLDDLFRKTKATPCIYWTMNEKSQKKMKDERKKEQEAA